MIKMLLILIILIGAMVLINCFAPGSWASGFHVFGAYIPWALLALAVVVFFAARALK
jgi:hypothetical protein